MLVKAIGWVFYVVALLMGLVLFIASFGLWAEIIGPIGYVLALFAAPDFILLVIQIIKRGFLDWYVLTFIGAVILFWLSGWMRFKDD